MNLPILDKIYHRTLCLQDYHLSEGNCRGLADACRYLDMRVVNRMLFNNCGLDGDLLAIILEGVLKMQDFKALIFCRQALNANALSMLAPIIKRPFPYQFDELVLIDTKMGATLIE